MTKLHHRTFAVVQEDVDRDKARQRSLVLSLSRCRVISHTTHRAVPASARCLLHA
jgi:hypothetical protein